MLNFHRAAIAALILFVFGVIAPREADAQSGARLRGSKLDEGQKRLGIGKIPGDLSQLGYVVADGVVFLPTASFETGYNSNPDELFSAIEGSPYGLANANGVLAFIRQTGATTVAVRGTALQYNGDIKNSSRWDAGAAIDNAYAVAPGITATFGGYYLRDEINLVPSDNAGGYSQLAYKDDGFEAFARIKGDQIAYLGGVDNAASIPVSLLPFLKPNQFDVRRLEGVAGFIFGPAAKVGFYGELGGSDLNYLSQNAEALLDRDAGEFWAVAGVRLNLHRTLVIDAGWRVNHRSIEDRTAKEHSSSFFDGKLTWAPADNFSIQAEIDRTLVEPVTAFAVVGDRTRYAATANYIPAPLWSFSASLRYEVLDQIGDVLEYREIGAGLAVAYEFSERTAIYGLIDYEHVEETFTGDTYDRVQIGAGTRVKF